PVPPSPDQVIARMQGRLSTTRLLSTAQAAPAPSTRPGPASAAAGPAITSPNMPTPNPPKVENELARDTRSAGGCRGQAGGPAGGRARTPRPPPPRRRRPP